MNDEEKTYKKLLDDLKNLPKVEAPKNFETGLWRKINSSTEPKKTGFWEKFLSPARLAPAAVAIATAIIIFVVVDANPEEMEDPLNIAPRLRADLVIIETTQEFTADNEKKSVRQKDKLKESTEGLLPEKKDNTPPLPKVEGGDIRLLSETESEAKEQFFTDELDAGKSDSDGYRSNEVVNLGGNIAPSVISNASNKISKENINFMQRNLSAKEKMEVQQLKMKVQPKKSAKTEQK